MLSDRESKAIDRAENCVRMYEIPGRTNVREVLGADSVVMAVVDGEEFTGSVRTLLKAGINVFDNKVELHSVVVGLAVKPTPKPKKESWLNKINSRAKFRLFNNLDFDEATRHHFAPPRPETQIDSRRGDAF